jgi:hypothetical protein
MYKLTNPIFGNEITSVIKQDENMLVPFDPDNTDYQAYLKFLAEGGQTLPADS